MPMREITFKKGEIRKLEFLVRSSVKNDGIIITDAKWQLTDAGKRLIVAEGCCDINSDSISAVVSFDTKGMYYLDVIVVIPPETIIERITVRVVD